MKYLVLLLVLLFSSASAQTRDTWAAPWDGYILPIGTAPIVGGCAIDAGFRIANYLSYNSGSWGEINTDVEVWTAKIGIRASSPIGEFSAAIPIYLAWGGILDPVLNVIHRWLGVGFSPEPPLSEIRYSLASGENKVVSGTRFGIGDALLSWAYNLEPFWVRTTLGIPTGDANQFFGSGGWRIQLSAGFEQKLFGVQIGVLVPFGVQTALEVFKPQTSLQMRLWWQLPYQLPVLLELHASTSPVKIGGQFAATVVAIRVVWQTSAGQFSFVEDISPTLPDVVLAWDKQFVC
ncbi:MAG: hypothetical protein RLZZ156_372 [Deinococcota bacterium]